MFRPHWPLIFLVVGLLIGSTAEARRVRRPAPKPVKTSCWVFLTMDDAQGMEKPASLDLCAMNISPNLVHQVLATYGQGRGKSPNNSISGTNVLLEVSMRLCSQWYAMEPGKLSHCANKKMVQMMDRARRSTQKPVPPPRIYLGGLPPLPGMMPVPSAPLSPPKSPVYGDLDRNELARSERYCQIAFPDSEAKADCLKRQVSKMRDFLGMDKAKVGEGDLNRSRKHCESVAGDNREGYFGCLMVQVDRILRYQTADPGNLDPLAVGRAEALCGLRYGDDRGNHYYCLSQEIRRLANP